MRVLTDGGQPDRFLLRLRSTRQRILFLDYDGTLAPFVVKRDEAFPYPGVTERIEAILATGGTRVIMVTGRTPAEILALLQIRRTVEVWGSHGWEYAGLGGPDDDPSSLFDAELQAVRDEAIRAARASPRPGDVEPKPFSVAVHWRQRGEADAAAIRAATLQAWHGPAQHPRAEIHDFDGGVEFRFKGRDKGFAIRQTLDGLTGEAAIAYLGDDLTDEDAFLALGDRGLRVLVRPALRPTAADLWIRPPEELLRFLDDWLAHSG